MGEIRLHSSLLSWFIFLGCACVVDKLCLGLFFVLRPAGTSVVGAPALKELYLSEQGGHIQIVHWKHPS